jgi:hypothetical protein
VENGAQGTTIGGLDQRSEGNRIVNGYGAGVNVAHDAGTGTVIERNLGFANAGMLIDLDGNGLASDGQDGGAGNGVGNGAGGPNGGVQAPAIIEATPTFVSGTAAPRAKVLVYLVPGSTGGEESHMHGHVETFVAKANARADGSWTVSVPAGVLSIGRKVTATQDAGLGTSELALNTAVTAVKATTQEDKQQQDPAPAPYVPPAPPVDNQTPPSLVSVFGMAPPAGDGMLLTVPLPQALTGQARGQSGVARVDVALALPIGRAQRHRSQRCSFLDFTRARYAVRDCTRPLFAKALGTVTWRLPLTRRARKVLRKGRRYVLYVRLADSLGHTATRTVGVRFR